MLARGIDIRYAGTRALSWRRLSLLCEQLAGMPDTATWRRLRGVDADWSVEVAMLAAVLHTLQVANWQRGADPKKPRSAEKTYPPPILSPSQRAQEEAKRNRPPISAGRLLQFKERTGYATGA